MALRIGVVGMGGIGNTHAKAYKELANCGRLVGVCDVVKEKADKAAAAHGVRPYYSLKEMLAHEEMDVVDVTTGGYENGSWHFEPAMEALAAGKHVLCEKPLSNDIGEARELVRYAAERKLYLGCNLNHYFTPTAERAKKYMDDGLIGEMVYCLFKVGFHGGEETYSFNKSPRFNQPYAHMKAFLTHPFSVMRHFCGNITHVQTFSTRPGFRRNKGDLLLSVNSVHVRFANDTVGYLLSQRGDAVWGLGGWWSCEVAGSKGAFCIENCIERLTYWPAPKQGQKLGLGESPTPEVLDTGIKDFGATFPLRIKAFLEDVTGGVPREHLRSSGRDALATLEYIWAVIESYENGGAVVRPAPLPTIHGDPKVEKKLMIKLGVNSVLFQGHDLATAFKVIAWAGYDGIELSAIKGMCEHLDLGRWREQVEPIKALAAEHKLALLSIEEAALDEGRLEACFEAAAALGIGVVNVGPGGKSSNPDDLGRQTDLMARLAERAAGRGVTLCVKAHVGACIFNTATTLAAMKKISSPGFGIDMDPSHIYRAGENPEQALPAVLARVKHVHIRDCKGRGPSPGEPKDQACGRGDIDLFGYCKAMTDGRYSGPVCLEVIGAGQYELAQRAVIAAESYGYLNACLRKLGVRKA